MSLTNIPLAQNFTELLAFLNYAKKYPDYPGDQHVSAYVQDVIDHGHLDRGPTVFTLACTFMSLALLVVCARLYARAYVTTGRLGPDDWAIIPATLAAIALVVIECWVVKRAGVGQHSFLLPASSIIYAFQFEAIGYIVFMTGATLIKLSICLFLLRLCPFTDVVGRRLALGTLAFIVLTGVVSISQTIFECSPVRATFDLTARLYGSYHCTSTWKALECWTAIYAVTDLWLLVLPWRFLLHLKMPFRKRLGLVGIFSLGLIASVFALLKFSAMKPAYDSWDPSWRFYHALIYSQLELTFGLIAASLPALGFLILKAIPNAGTPPNKADHVFSQHWSAMWSRPRKQPKSMELGLTDIMNTAITEVTIDEDAFAHDPEKALSSGEALPVYCEQAHSNNAWPSEHKTLGRVSDFRTVNPSRGGGSSQSEQRQAWPAAEPASMLHRGREFYGHSRASASESSLDLVIQR